MTFSKKDTQHDKIIIILSVFMLSVAIYFCYAECRYAECRYAECRAAATINFLIPVVSFIFSLYLSATEAPSAKVCYSRNLQV